jgi:hypothetical protein
MARHVALIAYNIGLVDRMIILERIFGDATLVSITKCRGKPLKDICRNVMAASRRIFLSTGFEK